jgi:spermidine synthase
MSRTGKKKPPSPESSGPQRLLQYEVLIFITGAVTLSLEVLASRIMTPYFGVSLYIWAGILSITLIFLALGYQLGGQISQRRDRGQLQVALLTAPLWAALSIFAAALLYPVIFPQLSRINLIIASFLGGTILLALPLVVLSAMNPLLIALGRDARSAGDGGAGRVFFISTVGSVAGVLLTAFLLIPHLTNFRSLLWMSLSLGLLVGGMAVLNREIAGSKKKRLLATGVLIVLLSGGLLVGQRSYLHLIAGASGPRNYEILAEYTSVFGNIKVVAMHPREAGDKTVLIYLQDGLIQNRITADGVPLGIVNVMVRLIEAYAPEARQALVLGVAAGQIPRYLHRHGLKVTAVEINPNSLAAASRFFYFDPRAVKVHLEDARTFVRRHPGAYDVVVADLFHGDFTPDYLLTVEFFREVQACLQPGGVTLINTWFDPANPIANHTILATVCAVFPHVLVLNPSSGDVATRGLILAAHTPLSPEVAIKLADRNSMSALDYQTLTAARVVNPMMLKNVKAVSDDHNIFSVLLAGSQLRYRSLLNKFPPDLLVN